jgi:S-layer homology domain
MTQNPNNPNNNRRRRLTADELIAIFVAFLGLGGIFWWSLTHRSAPGLDASLNNGEQVASSNGITQTFPLTVAASPMPTATAQKTTAPSPHVTASTEARNSRAADPAAAIAGGAAAIAVAPDEAVAQPTSSTPSFQDVPAQYWGKDYIAVLKKRGVLDDFGNGKFDPNASITRGEYAKMLDRAFTDRAVSQQVLEFKDIPDSYPRRVAIDKAVKMGFMTGYSPSKFAPEENIPRYQMQISLSKGMNLATPGDAEASLAKYGDANVLPQYARSKMGAAIVSGFVIKDGQDNKLQPTKPATRGEAAALIYQALVKDGKIPAGK